VILKHSSRVELYIDARNEDDNRKIFDKLHSEKTSIEAKFGGEIEWQRLDDKRASRIAVSVSKHAGLKDEDKWTKCRKT